MKKLLTLLIVSLLFVGIISTNAHAARKTLGATTVNNLPLHYGDTAEISWVLTKRPIRPMLGVECYQAKPDGDGYWWAYVSETYIRRDLIGSASVEISNEASRPEWARLDPTASAECLVLIWDEGARNGKQPVFIAGGGNFTLLPQVVGP